MTADAAAPRIADASLPARGARSRSPEPGEQPVAWSNSTSTSDAYAPGLLTTPRRLMAAGADRSSWHSWALHPGQTLDLSDHGGVGALELRDADARIAGWRFTLGQHAAAQRLADRFERLGGERAAVAAGAPSATCPHCRALLPAPGVPCPHCAGEAVAEAARRRIRGAAVDLTLLRLGGSPIRTGGDLAGFLLTLASAATLVPPYDDAADGRRRSRPERRRSTTCWWAATSAGCWCRAAGLVLGWARTYILALVSERLDLRTATTSTCQFLRILAAIGLMARIGSETDRPTSSCRTCSTSRPTLMIAMTAAIWCRSTRGSPP